MVYALKNDKETYTFLKSLYLLIYVWCLPETVSLPTVRWRWIENYIIIALKLVVARGISIILSLHLDDTARYPTIIII